MAIREPLQTDTFAFEVDAVSARVPFEKPVVDAKREAAELVSPDEVRPPAVGHVDDDLGNGVRSKRVIRRDIGDVLASHQSTDDTRRLIRRSHSTVTQPTRGGHSRLVASDGARGTSRGPATEEGRKRCSS